MYSEPKQEAPVCVSRHGGGLPERAAHDREHGPGVLLAPELPRDAAGPRACARTRRKHNISGKYSN